MVLLKNQSSAVRLRHLVPFAFVLFLIFTTALGVVCKYIWLLELAVVVLHLTLGLIFGAKKTKKISEVIRMPFLFMMLHISYGVGYLAGIFTNIEK